MSRRAGRGQAELKAEIKHDYSSSHDGIVPQTYQNAETAGRVASDIPVSHSPYFALVL